ncbi:class I SAM-dependent methyltransferase [Pedobacter sp. D749]|uniref:class I SAM-dependent methyltransferase n=1 Tax=Pedobacter sp. D749 TaxID=2856523 RepID=UPI001C580252|nr:class I SAM-dependent methyltransferase [Pedobacter sp. D749]QXU40126.1 hypothetical protein KYH19_14025 [Pedobacter sp. D749]
MNHRTVFELHSKKLTGVLATPEVIDTVNQLHHLYSKLTDIEGVLAPSDTDEVFEELSENGTRVNPYMAAYCFLDYLRSYKFTLGIKNLIDDKLNQGNQKPLQILYAGTGPYASLILPLTTVFSANQIQVTLLDIHQSSLDAVSKLISTFNLEAYFNAYIKADATLFTPNDHIAYDIIISETMDKALRKEPQVAIFNHLRQFLKPDGAFIPEEIRVDLYQSKWCEEKNPAFEYFLDTETRKHNATFREKITNLIAINKHSVTTFKRTNPDHRLFLKTIDPKNFKAAYTALLLLTEVQVYKEITLIEDESVLTEKDYLSPLNDRILQSGLSFYYKMDNDPRIICD